MFWRDPEYKRIASRRRVQWKLKEQPAGTEQVNHRRCETGLFFQPSNRPTVNSTATLQLQGGELETSQFSVCSWIWVHHFREKTYVYSYVTSNKDNNELNLGIKHNYIYAAVGGKYVYGSKTRRNVPHTWYHVCVVANSTQVHFYVDGEKDSTKEVSERRISLGGTIVLGQETDLFVGGYQEQQSFSGIILDYNLYNRALAEDEIVAMATCNSTSESWPGEGDLASWKSSPWEVEGDVEERSVSQDDVCRKNGFVINIFARQMVHSQAHHLCRQLKSTLALPVDEATNEQVYNAALHLTNVCKPNNHATGFLWLGASDAEEEGVWRDFENNALVTFTNFSGGKTPKSTKQNCLTFDIPPYVGQWNDVSCKNTYKFCAPCREVEPVTLRMRGLCEEDEKAAWFRMYQEPLAEYVNFRGFTKYILHLEGNSWVLDNIWTNETVASWFTHDKSYPFGLHTWTLLTNFSVCEQPAGTPLPLSLSACYDDEFTCGDGTCVDMSMRCDLRVDCPDQTDEMGCNKLSRPREYLEALPPPGVNGESLKVDLVVDVKGFSEIDTRDMKLTVDFSIMASWYDIRLQYRNLKNLSDLNYVEASRVWTPRFQLPNADFPRVSQKPHVVTVRREMDPEEDDPSLSVHDEIYTGSENPLELRQDLNAPFLCIMDLQNFPFDTQHCQIILELSSAQVEYTTWSNVIVNYLGEAKLTEYEIGEMVTSLKEERGYSRAVVEVILYRRFTYYLASAYLPTFMLIIISYASLFCKKENRDLRVMMSITTLLVLYALYQQIADGLPRTSYTKAIDVWCFFAITYIFSQVILHVAVDVDLLTSLVRRARRQHRTITEVKPYGEPRRRSCVSLGNARVFYIIVFFVFAVAYWTVVIQSIDW
ncbi:uncharacterized protein LOC143040827 [Oratosquilla oratoria]|uniref:uncharacterized protein LOC143040827 n=1 Tax=Oratosquilla oratoria TaxID=337810 RepID=UPI003F76EDF7